MKTCNEPGCSLKRHARGVCQAHYNRFYHVKKKAGFRATSTRHAGIVRVAAKGWGCL